MKGEIMSEKNELWQKQKGERSEGFELFKIFRDLGSKRKLKEIIPIATKRNDLPNEIEMPKLKTLSSRWKWIERVRAYDNYLDEQIIVKNIEELKEMNISNAKLGKRFTDNIDSLITKIMVDGKLEPNQKAFAMQKLADSFVKVDSVQRLSYGQATVIEESNTNISGSLDNNIYTSGDVLKDVEELEKELDKL